MPGTHVRCLVQGFTSLGGKSAAGFSLIEVLASVAIGSVVVMSALDLAGQSLVFQHQQATVSNNTLGLVTMAESLGVDAGTAGTNLDAGDHGPVSVSPDGHAPPVDVRWTVTPDNPLESVMKIEISASHNGQSPVSMTFFRPIPLGSAANIVPASVALVRPAYVVPAPLYYWRSFGWVWGPTTCTRVVECWTSPIATHVADSFCAGSPMPPTTGGCAHYYWTNPGWGPCTNTGSGWEQTRMAATCIDTETNLATADSNCGIPPATTQTCAPPASFQ